MDDYREMTHSNQAREDDALFAGIEVYDGEDPSWFEGWLDAVKQACNMMDRNLQEGVDEKVNWSHQRDTLHDEHLLDWQQCHLQVKTGLLINVHHE